MFEKNRKHCRADAVPGNVRDIEAYAAAIDLKNVVEVAAHLACRSKDNRKRQPLRERYVAREKPPLDPHGAVQVELHRTRMSLEHLVSGLELLEPALEFNVHLSQFFEQFVPAFDKTFVVKGPIQTMTQEIDVFNGLRQQVIGAALYGAAGILYGRCSR